MRVWLTQTGEPLPLDGENVRLFRTGLLARTLAEKGHEVVWWASSFDHSRKRQRGREDGSFHVLPGFRIELLHAPGYRRHVSLARCASHRTVADKFGRLAVSRPRPDVIVTSLPTLELSASATRFARAQGIPSVLDVRDLWPDIFLDLAPAWGRAPLRWALSPFFSMAREACANAAAITAPNESFVQWGTRNAGRARTPWDRVFPLGYSEMAPSADALARAAAFWKAEGLDGRTGQFIACFFGTMGRQFDLETVIEAARLLQSRGRFCFVLCGDGDHLQRHKELARGCTNVSFPGWIGAAEIWKLMRLSSVGLAPYRSTETFIANIPNKPIEYLSAGLPIVSSLKGVVERLLGDYECGVHYENGQADQLASTLSALSRTPERLALLSRNARTLFQDQFVAEKVYGEMADYLQDIGETMPLSRGR